MAPCLRRSTAVTTGFDVWSSEKEKEKGQALQQERLCRDEKDSPARMKDRDDEERATRANRLRQRLRICALPILGCVVPGPTCGSRFLGAYSWCYLRPCRTMTVSGPRTCRRLAPAFLDARQPSCGKLELLSSCSIVLLLRLATNSVMQDLVTAKGSGQHAVAHSIFDHVERPPPLPLSTGADCECRGVPKRVHRLLPPTDAQCVERHQQYH